MILDDLATQIVSLTDGEGREYLRGPMKLLFLPLVCVGAMSLTSCGLVRTATQLPGSLLQTVGRTVGFGIEGSEVTEGEKAPQVQFEQAARKER